MHEKVMTRLYRVRDLLDSGLEMCGLSSINRGRGTTESLPYCALLPFYAYSRIHLASKFRYKRAEDADMLIDIVVTMLD